MAKINLAEGVLLLGGEIGGRRQDLVHDADGGADIILNQICDQIATNETDAAEHESRRF